MLLVIDYYMLKDGYLDFSHLTELKSIYITEIYMRKQYKSSIMTNHKITNKNFFDGVPIKVYVVIFSSPEHKVLRVSYCDRPMSVVRRLSSVNNFFKHLPPLNHWANL